MRSRVFPWILLVLVGGAWAVTTLLGSDTEGSASREALQRENRALREDVLRLQTEVEGLRASGGTTEPVLRGSQAAPTAASTEVLDPRAEARAEARRAEAEQSRRMEAVYAIMRPWIGALESVGDRREREDAIAAIRAALASSDRDVLLAGLLAVQALGDLKYDRGDFRTALLEHVHSTDRQERRAAREALSLVNPQPEDVAMWAEEAQEATREYAETIAGAIVSSDGWRVERQRTRCCTCFATARTSTDPTSCAAFSLHARSRLASKRGSSSWCAPHLACSPPCGPGGSEGGGHRERAGILAVDVRITG